MEIKQESVVEEENVEVQKRKRCNNQRGGYNNGKAQKIVETTNIKEQLDNLKKKVSEINTDVKSIKDSVVKNTAFGLN